MNPSVFTGVLIVFSATLSITLFGAFLAIAVLLKRNRLLASERDELKEFLEVTMTPESHLVLARHLFNRSNCRHATLGRKVLGKRGQLNDKLLAIEHLKNARTEHPVLVCNFIQELGKLDQDLVRRELLIDPLKPLEVGRLRVM